MAGGVAFAFRASGKVISSCGRCSSSAREGSLMLTRQLQRPVMQDARVGLQTDPPA